MTVSRWPLLIRLVGSAALAVAALVAVREGFIPSAGPVLGVCGFVVAYAVLLHLVEVRGLPGRDRASGGALFLDAAALVVLLYFTGDLENPMRSLHVLPVIAGALIHSRLLGVALAAWTSLLFSGMVVLTLNDVLPHRHLDILEGLLLHDLVRGGDNPDAVGYLQVQLGYFAFLMFGSALAFGTLAQRIRAKEEEARREHEQMALLLETLPVGVALVETGGEILLANRVARDLLEGKTVDELEPDLGVRARLEERFEGPRTFETTVGGRVLNHVLARSKPGEPAVWVFRDMTEQNRLMGQMIHRSKMADLGLLAAGIAHEVGNPLSSMSAIIQVLRMKPAPESLDERLRSLLGHVDRITGIVRQVSEYARPSTGKRVRVDLARVAAKAVEIFGFHRKSKGVSVDVKPAGRPVGVTGDEDQLVQVVLNLLLNAADASPEDSVLEVRIDGDPGDARLSVRDSGSGMNEETVRRMFLPFFTTKEQGEGVGLGLFVCDTIARNHGGRFQVESAPGSGTTVTLHLPAAEEES